MTRREKIPTRGDVLRSRKVLQAGEDVLQTDLILPFGPTAHVRQVGSYMGARPVVRREGQVAPTRRPRLVSASSIPVREADSFLANLLKAEGVKVPVGPAHVLFDRVRNR